MNAHFQTSTQAKLLEIDLLDPPDVEDIVGADFDAIAFTLATTVIHDRHENPRSRLASRARPRWVGGRPFYLFGIRSL